MRRYNWEQDDWPNFTFTLTGVEDDLITFWEKLGRVTGAVDALPAHYGQDLIIDIILAEAIKTSAIEGEFPNRVDVLSSIRKNLGLPYERSASGSKSAEDLGALMIDLRKTFREPLSEEKLFEWHRLLLGTATDLAVGHWRTHGEPMQVISGALGKEKVHFEAPPSERVSQEMARFVQWFNDTGPNGKHEIRKAPVRSALAHLYFETIHPFEDGNGRLGRAITEKALSQTIGRPVVLSLSAAIEAEKRLYYTSLEQAQRSNHITPWVEYFVHTIVKAQTQAEAHIDFTLRKTRFFDRFNGKLNERQQTVVQRMLEEGPKGFEGGMNAKKYIGITKTSKATATRDLQHLLDLGAFVLSGNGGGRSTSYQVNL